MRSFLVRSIWALTGCVLLSSSSPPAATISSVLALHQPSPVRDALDADRGASVYVLGANGLLNKYDTNGRLIGQLQLSDTQGISMCGDGRNYLFIVDSPMGSSVQFVEKFRIGSTKPSLLLNAGGVSQLFSAFTCTVNQSTLDVALIGYLTCSSGCYGGVELFANNQTKPYGLTGMTRPFFLSTGSYSPDGNLWVAGTYYVNPAVAKASDIFDPIFVPRDISNGSLTGVQVDAKGNLLLEDAHTQQIDIYPGGLLIWPQKGAQTYTVSLTGTSSPAAFELTPSGTKLFTLDGSKVYGFLYPAGGLPFTTINFQASGLAMIQRP
jgi:hypothetical protein